MSGDGVSGDGATARRRPRPGPAPTPGGEGDAGAPVTDPPLALGLVALGVLAVAVIAVVGAVVCVLLTPARIGTTLVPVGVVAAVAVNIALPLLTFRMSGSHALAALPVLVFFVAGWALSISPGGDVLLAGGSDTQTAISYATLLLPVVAGAVTSVRAR